MIKLMVLTTAWLTALSAAMQAAAQISLTAEPPVGRHEVQGVVVENEGKYQSTGYTPADLLFLLCEPDEIPGYTVVVREYRGREIDGGTFAWMAPFGHTYVWLNSGGLSSSAKREELQCRVTRQWFPVERAQAYLARQIGSFIDLIGGGSIYVQVSLYQKRASQNYEDFQRGSAAVFHRGTPSGIPLGTESWYSLGPKKSTLSLCFVYDRSFVRVMSHPDPALGEAVAQSILYRLLIHPKGVVARGATPAVTLNGKTVQSPYLAALNGTVVAPVSVLKPFGVKVEVSRSVHSWHVTLQREERWITLEAFRREARTPDGMLKLERAVFPFRGELVVPLRQVAEALGLTVQAQ
jgi:hypothetical protein